MKSKKKKPALRNYNPKIIELWTPQFWSFITHNSKPYMAILLPCRTTKNNSRQEHPLDSCAPNCCVKWQIRPIPFNHFCFPLKRKPKLITIIRYMPFCLHISSVLSESTNQKHTCDVVWYPSCLSISRHAKPQPKNHLDHQSNDNTTYIYLCGCLTTSKLIRWQHYTLLFSHVEAWSFSNSLPATVNWLSRILNQERMVDESTHIVWMCTYA